MLLGGLFSGVAHGISLDDGGNNNFNLNMQIRERVRAENNLANAYNEIANLRRLNEENFVKCNANHAHGVGATAQVNALISALREVAPDHPLLRKTGNYYSNGKPQLNLSIIYDNAHDKIFYEILPNHDARDHRRFVTLTKEMIEEKARREREERAIREQRERDRLAAQAEKERRDAEERAELERKRRAYQEQQALIAKQIAAQKAANKARRLAAYRFWAEWGPDELAYQYVANPGLFGETKNEQPVFTDDEMSSWAATVAGKISKFIDMFVLSIEIEKELIVENLTALGMDDFITKLDGDTGEYVGIKHKTYHTFDFNTPHIDVNAPFVYVKSFPGFRKFLNK